jgi:hypothetical protein
MFDEINVEAQGMRAGILSICLLVLLSLAGCTTFSVSSDYDKAINFGAYRTYRWQKSDNPSAGRDLLDANPLVYRRVKEAVDRELIAKGYLFRAAGPVDFMVSAIGTISEQARIAPPAPDPYGYYPGRGGWAFPWWGEPYPYVVYYDEGALLLDVTDVAKKELAWRGIVRGLFQEYRSPEMAGVHVDEAVRKLLSLFPPGRAGK